MNDEIKNRVAKITNANTQIKEIYALLDELGIKYKKTTCSKCRKDLLNILREEVGMIDDASEQSDFNDGPMGATDNFEGEYVYLLSRPQSWNGHIMDQDTPTEVIRDFVRQFPHGYYRKNNNTNNED